MPMGVKRSSGRLARTRLRGGAEAPPRRLSRTPRKTPAAQEPVAYQSSVKFTLTFDWSIAVNPEPFT